jgi:ribosomal protein L25 (general stress protein Ctc)
MSDSTFQQPSQEDLAGFVAGDPVAVDRVMTLLAPQLFRWATKHYGKQLIEADIEDLVYAALDETCRHSAKYDPSKTAITTYIIKLIMWRAPRIIDSVKKIRKFEDTSDQAQAQLPQGVYNSTEARDLEIRISREDFFHAVREQLQGLDKEFFELELRGAESDDFVQAVERHGSFQDSESEAKNRRGRVRRALKKIAEGLGLTLEDLWKE